ncbi:hypothetical protein [Stenotrophomonas pictorum]|nr:hypothetical protein [Stenotrophomonas pictorum]
MTTPPLPPGFVLDPPARPAGGLPPLPPGFVLDSSSSGPITDIPAVNALPPDFSDVAGNVASTEDQVMGDGWKPGFLRDVAMGGRSVLQGAGSLIGAFGGDA